jgi:tripartite-type tricarboxylate transporter receptor subunit TctC
MTRLSRMAGTFMAGLMLSGAAAVTAQEFPNKPLRIYTSPAGGGGDFAARSVAQGIAGPLGQSVVVDNRATLLANELASKAAPDGYSLLASGGSLIIYPLLYKAPFQTADLAPISQITREVSVLAVHPSLPVKSVRDLVNLAKKRPGELNYAMVPSGSANQLAGELLKAMGGVSIVSVGYKGSAATVTAVIGGEAQLTMSDPVVILPHAKSGRLRALAVSSAKSSPLAPGLPTISESGLPGYEMEGMTSLYAPVKTPAAIINRLNQEVVRALSLPEARERMLNGGVEAAPTSPEGLAAIVKAEIAKAAKLIRDAGIKGD